MLFSGQKILSTNYLTLTTKISSCETLADLRDCYLLSRIKRLGTLSLAQLCAKRKFDTILD